MSSITDSTKNKIKRKVKKNKSKGKSKSNAHMGYSDTKKDISNKREKVRKRIKKNTDLTPKVAKNTRADAGKYAQLPTYAYRPADSPSHILKTKNDLVTLANQDIKKFTDEFLNTDEEIQKVIRERELAQRRAQEYKTTLKQELIRKNNAKLQEEQERIDFEKTKASMKAERDDMIKNMRRQHEQEQAIAHWNSQLNEATLDTKSDKLVHQIKMEALKQRAEQQQHKRQHDIAQQQLSYLIDKYKWEGSYDIDPETGAKTLKDGAKDLAELGIDFDIGERTLAQEQHKIELNKINQSFASEKLKLEQELDKINTRTELEKAPEYQKLLKEHAEAVKNAREAELNQQQAKRNKKLQQEIDALNYKIELIKAEDKVDEKLKQQLLQKQAELQTAKATHKLIRDQAKVERKLAEISAQRGEAERLQQLLNEHQQQVNELSLQNNNSREQLSQLKQTYSEYIPIARDIDAQTKAYQNEVAMAINRLTPHLTQQEQQSLKDITDPTLALQRMIELGQQRIANRGEYTGRALAVAENIKQVFQHDENLAKIGLTLANVQQQLRNNQQEAAFATVPDFETAQVAAPPPEEIERKFSASFR